ncbi:MAG: hypothetical protein M1823_004261 [Watsoniomyces obsoletus]|nr:MAG: hypothetical protein M1823_004261 [Watsoniomyces obsoletus]
MPREAEPSLNERAFILQALQEDIRLDGRAFNALRPVELKFGDELGVADLKWGGTRVLARVTAEVTRPYPDRPFTGIFNITTELSSMASPAFEAGRQNEQEVILSRILEKTIRRSNALDTESLCILAGQLCWSIRVDVHVLDYDGGLTDASCMAVIAALRHFRRPFVTVEGDHATVHGITERSPVPLAILHSPFCMTFSFYHGGDVILLDATLQEEQVREAELIISLNGQGELCQMAKHGGMSIEALSLMKCMEMAAEHVEHLGIQLSSKLEEDAKAKDLGGLIAELSAENDR